jgi:predicted ArsR family transcriptional regulator
MQVDGARRGALEDLTARQVEVLVIVTRYVDRVGAACPARYVARELEIHHEAVRTHFASLARKGWLRAKTSPATPNFETASSRQFSRNWLPRSDVR